MKVKARVSMTLRESATIEVEICEDRFDDTANSYPAWDRHDPQDRADIIEEAVKDIVREESGNPWGELEIYSGITHTFDLNVTIEEADDA